MRVSDDGVDGRMSGEAAHILNAEEAMKPQFVNKFSTAAFHAFNVKNHINCEEVTQLPTDHNGVPLLYVGSSYRSTSGPSFLKTYLSATCNMQVMHIEYAVDCTTLGTTVLNPKSQTLICKL